MRAQNEVRWGGGWAAASPGAPRRDIGTRLAAQRGHSVDGARVVEVGQGHSNADVMGFGPLSVRRGHVLSLSRQSRGTGPFLRCVGGQVLGARLFVHPLPRWPWVLSQSRMGSSSLREKGDAPASAQGCSWEVSLS